MGIWKFSCKFTFQIGPPTEWPNVVDEWSESRRISSGCFPPSTNDYGDAQQQSDPNF